MTAALTLRPPSKFLMLMEARAINEFGAFLGALPLLHLVQKGDGHAVLVLPGLITSDTATRPLRSFLKNHGYAVRGWGQGRNLGLRPGVQDALVNRLIDMNETSGRKVSVVGWSLGGLYARQLAKTMPDRVRSVITLGSPFAAGPKATNAWRTYEVVSGQSAEDTAAQLGGDMAAPPPVPTTAIFSRSDGICAWQGCVEKPGAQVENIEVAGASHCGMGHNPAIVYAVADRLAQPEGEWKPFDRKGWRSVVYPDPAR